MKQETAEKLVNHGRECGSKEFIRKDGHGEVFYVCCKCGLVEREVEEKPVKKEAA